MTDEEVTPTDPFAPRSFDDFVGQTELKRRLKIYMDAAIADHEPLPHVLLATHPGQGKTAIAYLICKYLDDPAFQIDLSSMSPPQFVATMRRFPGGVLFIDEAHRASKGQLEGLLTLLAEGYISSPSGSRIEIPWLTAILATTEPESLPAALKERCAIQPEFVDYVDAESTQIVRKMGTAVNLEIPDEVAEGMGHACGGTPRIAKNMVKAYRALRHQEGDTTLEHVLDLCEVDRNGLTSKHHNYLRALDKLDGLAGAKPLMNMLRLRSESSLLDLERVLLMRNMIASTTRGRCLLPAGDACIRGVRNHYARS